MKNATTITINRTVRDQLQTLRKGGVESFNKLLTRLMNEAESSADIKEDNEEEDIEEEVQEAENQSLPIPLVLHKPPEKIFSVLK